MHVAGPQDLDDIITQDMWAFPSTLTHEEHRAQPNPLDFERVWLVKDAQSVAAMHASFEFGAFPIPGSTLPVAGLSMVGVHPQYRRRGILRAMIETHFNDCRRRGESVSALFAAEPTIYGRFGYGPASQDIRITIPRGAALKPVPGAADLTVRIETKSQSKHADMINTVHFQAGQQVGNTGLNRPGWVGRETPELQALWHHDLDPQQGKEPSRIVIVERAGTPVAYATFRRTLSWHNTGSQGTVTVTEAVAIDPASAHRLWSTLINFDLMSEVRPYMLATDDPILNMLANPRAVDQKVMDNLWTRVIDLPVALTARQYSADLDVVITVTDAIIAENAGTWRITAQAFGGPDGTSVPTVVRTDAPAQLTLDIADLGAVYLGGGSLAALAAAGHFAVSDPRKLGQASAAFAWPNAPVASWMF